MPGFVDVQLNPWATVADLLKFDAVINEQQPAVDPDFITDWLMAVSDLLYTLSGRQFLGTATASVRPSGNAMSTGTTGARVMYEVDLGPLWPVVDIQQVLVDGVAVDPSLYTLVNNRFVRALAGPGPDYKVTPWPFEQYLERPSSAIGTFEVTVTYGFPLPPLAKKAACAYAAQFIRRDLELDDHLPERAKNLTRSGLTMEVVNPEDLLEQGKTGIYDVDTFLQVYNPHHLTSPPFLFTPDRQPDRYRLVGYPSWYDGRAPLTFPFATGTYLWA